LKISFLQRVEAAESKQARSDYPGLHSWIARLEKQEREEAEALRNALVKSDNEWWDIRKQRHLIAVKRARAKGLRNRLRKQRQWDTIKQRAIDYSMKRSRPSSMRAVRGSRSAKKRARINRINNAYWAQNPSAKSAALSAPANIIYRNVASVPETNYIYAQNTSSLDSGNGLSLITWEQKIGGQAQIQSMIPMIPTGTEAGKKIGLKCRLTGLHIKGRLMKPWQAFAENVHIWLIRKAEANRSNVQVSEVWDPVSDVDSDRHYNRFRNPAFLANYKILKHWKFYMPATGQDDGTYPSPIGTIDGWIPSFKSFEKYFTLSDNYINTDAGGLVGGMTGAGYTFVMAVEGLSNGWVNNPNTYFTGNLKITFKEL